MEIKYTNNLTDYFEVTEVMNKVSKINKLIEKGWIFKTITMLLWSFIFIELFILNNVRVFIIVLNIFNTIMCLNKQRNIKIKTAWWENEPANKAEKKVELKSRTVILKDFHPSDAIIFPIDIYPYLFSKIETTEVELKKCDKVKIFETHNLFVIISLKNKRLRAFINKRFLTAENIEKLYELQSYFNCER